jgi:hypothetical protein
MRAVRRRVRRYLLLVLLLRLSTLVALTRMKPAPIAQGIEQRPPEPCAQVRILLGALCWGRSVISQDIGMTSNPRQGSGFFRLRGVPGLGPGGRLRGW